MFDSFILDNRWKVKFLCKNSIVFCMDLLVLT